MTENPDISRLENVRISLFKNVTAKENEPVEVHSILDDIRGGKWQKQIAEVRAEFARGGKDAANVVKKKLLPAVTFTGTFNRRHTVEAFAEHSGILCLDFDDLNGRMAEVKLQLAGDPYCLAIFDSPSKGVKFLTKIKPDANEHKRVFAAATAYFKQKYNMDTDKDGSDISRLCFVSYDPALIHNPDASIFELPPTEKTLPAQATKPRQTPRTAATLTRYVQAAVEAETRTVSTTPNGQRNAALNKAAFNLGQFVGAGALGRADAEQALMAAARSCKLPDQEAIETIQSGLRAGQKEPRQIPERTSSPKIQKQAGPSHDGTKADGRTATSPDNGKKGGRPSAPPSSEIAFRFAEENLKTKDGYLAVRHYRDQWYQFVKGWFPVTEIEIEKRVITFLQDDPALATFATNFYARNILRNLASFNLCGLDARIEMPCWLSTGEDARNWIAFSNIAINIWKYVSELAEGRVPTDYTRPVSPDLFSADFVPYPWDECAIPEKFLAYLERVQPDIENFNAVRRMMGLMLADVQKYEVFFQLNGLGANGKTVLLDIIEALVGFLNVCRVPLESLQPGSRFQTWPLAVSKVNICGEIATDVGSGALAAIEGVFKHCVSGGVIEVEHKGVDKITARCRARFILSGNSLPTFVDKSNAIWRRLRIIPFTVDLPATEQDVDLAKKIIKDELPAIALWAIDGLAEVIRDGRVPDCPAGDRMKDKHRVDCDHERMFLLERFEPGEDEDRLPSGELYGEYREWMWQNGYKPFGAGKFFARFETVFPCSEVKVLRIDGEMSRGVMRLRRRPNVQNVTNVTGC